MMENLTRKSLVGGSWITGHNLLARVSAIIKMAIIARLLTPAQFGLFGFASLVLSLLETFSETGIDQVLIQKPKLKPSQVTAGWLIIFGRSLILSLILYFGASLVADFFNNPAVMPLVRFSALIPLIKALKNPQLILMQKQLNFKPEFITRSSATLAELIVGVVVSLLTRNAWGLIAAMTANALATTAASYFVVKLPVLARPNLASIKENLAFSRWLWGSSLLSYLATQGDDLVVGKILGPSALGFYQNAYKIASLPATQITGVVAQVTYPAYALIQNDKSRLKRAYQKTLALTSLFSLSAGVIIIVLARPLTVLILGQNWLEIVPVLQVLTIYGTIRAIISTLGSLFTAVGHPEIITVHGLIMVSAMFLLIFPLTFKFGLIGTAWAVVLSIFASLPYLLVKARQIL